MLFFFNFKIHKNFKFQFLFITLVNFSKSSISDVVFFVVAVFLVIYLVIFFVFDHLDVDLDSGYVVAAN